MDKMTSVIPGIDRKVRVKGQRNEKVSPSDDSTRAFLNFSRENLNVSQSDIEQGITRKTSKCLKINRQMLLSLLAICLAIVCLAFEAIKIKKIVNNARDIETIKADLQNLKQRIYEENLLEEIRAFEQQLYPDEDDFNDTDLDDYNSNYDDYDANSNNYENDYETTSSMRSQSAVTSRSVPIAGDETILWSHPEPGETGEDESKEQHAKIKRFITEEPPNFLNSEAFRRSGSPSLQDDTNRQSTRANPGGVMFSKKYHDDRRLRMQQKKHDLKKSLETRGKSRRHIRPSRQIFAAHYGADSTLFQGDDEHTGNGRARHNEGIFKAWRSSDWMDDLGMNRYFSLATDGRLTVHETGLYLVYAQIHYLDEHDENGFHLLVNGRPILQCMVYSPGNGHKSRSCFSSQVTYLLSSDRIVLKEVGPARYTLFQPDKSFFGLVKLGDNRQTQNQNKHNSSLHPQTTPVL